MNDEAQVNHPEYFIRPRINKLLEHAVQKPLVVVCAGSGCGKTRAVYDFSLQAKNTLVWWRQHSEFDNDVSHFWEGFIHSFRPESESYSNELKELGFPDTEDKYNRYLSLRANFAKHHHVEGRSALYVVDDVHLIRNPQILKFIERTIYSSPYNRSIVLICREFPKINIAGMQSRGLVHSIYEEDLNFAETELALYLKQQELSEAPYILHEIHQDTKGWAFSVNLIARSLKKAPGYFGYVRNAMKQNIFDLFESEEWDTISKQLQRFLIRLSLIGHLSAELIEILAAGNDELLAEFRRQSDYIRFDIYANAYMIHHLFVDFLRVKQGILTDGEKNETYKITADWCRQNSFMADALNYYEKIEDYQSIESIFFDSVSYVVHDLAPRMAEIFERAPAETFDKVDFFAVIHLYTVVCLGRWQEFFRLAEYYGQKFLKLPEDDVLRNYNLGAIYFSLAIVRSFLCATNDRYDFDVYCAKGDEYLSKVPAGLWKMVNIPLGPWVSNVGSARAGAPQEYIEAIVRAKRSVSHCLGGIMAGIDDVCRGELLFHQGDVVGAETLFLVALYNARKDKQFEVMHRALFYNLRIAVMQGNRAKAEKAIGEITALLNEETYSMRFITCDIAFGWYRYILRQPEAIPTWLKESFATYGHTSFPENFGNQIKARYHYMTGNFPPLLAYIEEMKQRESVLYGRIEMLAMEACVYYRMKNKPKAIDALRAAYENAVLNGIVTPFIELGKDMRTLTMAALRDPKCGIPRQWLENINRKAAIYAKYQAKIISGYERETDINSDNTLSSRETLVLHDIFDGLSHSEVAVKNNLSINTVKLIMKNIYSKLHANNIIDLVRISEEQKNNFVK